MERAVVVNSITRYITEGSQLGRNVGIDEHTKLTETGLVDSLMLMGLISHCESEFSLQFALEDMAEANFSSVGALADFIARKLESGAGATQTDS